MTQYLNEEEIRQDKKHITRSKLVYRVLLANSDHAITIKEFENEYYNYIERKNYPKDRLIINVRSLSNILRTSKHIVFNKNNMLRYCQADSRKIWDIIDFSRYKDMVISSELIYRDYFEDLDELDIRDGYELFYVIKSSLDNWKNKDFDISCRRVPIMVIGDGNEAKQALHLLKEITPVDYYGYYNAYEERYGVRNAQGNSMITRVLSNYYLDGIYSVDVISMDDGDAVALKQALSKKNFWFIDEVEKIFNEICVNSPPDSLNKISFRKIGYSLNNGYLYDYSYNTVLNYFDKEIFTENIIDLNNYDRRLTMLSSFESAIYDKKIRLEYIEVAPKVYMSLSELERVYGLSLNDIYKLQEWVCQCSEKYFNAHSLWQQIVDAGLDKNLQNNEWLCNCIFRQQDTIFSNQIGGGIILSKDKKELNLGFIFRWIIEKYGKMTIQDLTSTINIIFSIKLKQSKVTENLKIYGLWDMLVTDSFDDYVDSLIVDNDTDVDDLFKEEFF